MKEQDVQEMIQAVDTVVTNSIKEAVKNSFTPNKNQNMYKTGFIALAVLLIISIVFFAGKSTLNDAIKQINANTNASNAVVLTEVESVGADIGAITDQVTTVNDSLATLSDNTTILSDKVTTLSDKVEKLPKNPVIIHKPKLNKIKALDMCMKSVGTLTINGKAPYVYCTDLIKEFSK